MGAHAAITQALVQRRLMPLDGFCTCACCNDDTLFRSDMDVSAYPIHHNDAMKLRYLGPCCNACTDDHVQCAGCDVATPADETRQDNEGDYWCAGCEQSARDDGVRFPT